MKVNYLFYILHNVEIKKYLSQSYSLNEQEYISSQVILIVLDFTFFSLYF